MRNNVVVVLFCGPRTDSGHPSTLRITRAIEVARSERARLLIVGDAHNGSDLDLFVSMAKEHGVDRVIPVRVPTEQANTKRNAQQIVVELSRNVGVDGVLKPVYFSLNAIYLVTDHWHMRRASLHLADELKLVRGVNIPEIIPMNVTSAMEIDEAVLEREQVLIEEFLDSTRRGQKKHVAAQAS